MTKVKQQLLDVMSIVHEQSKLNPDGATFQLTTELFAECPDYASLLKKLEQEYDVIEINQPPNAKDYGDADLGMYENEYPNDFARYMSYSITLKPTFEAFYKAEYHKHRFTLDTLTKKNLSDVLHVMQDIDDEMGITGSDEVTYTPSDISIEHKKVLKFLEKIGIVQNITDTYRGAYLISVKVILPAFDEVFDELRTASKEAKDLNYKTTDLVNALLVEEREEVTNKTNDDTVKPTPKKIEVNKLQPSHYSSRTGVLSLSPFDKVTIARKGSVKRKNGSKYDQCWLLECLFKTVNSLKSGVNLSTVLGVNDTIIGKKQVKKVRNTVDEINEKVAGKGGPKNLIKVQGHKVFVNSSYL